jgi:hypothetical protein
MTAAQAGALRDTTHDFDDVTVLFAPPPELLEQSTARDEEVTAFHAQPRSGWVAEDEATVAIRTSFTLPALEPLKPLGAAQPAPQTRPAPPQARMPTPPAPMPIPPGRLPTPAAKMPTPPRPDTRRAAISVDIGEAELGAILGPRRAARWLALGGVVTLLLVILAVARLAP